MIQHITDERLKDLPEYYRKTARGRGATVGAMISDGFPIFVFVFKVAHQLEAAIMPLEDDPADFIRVCRAIQKRTWKDYLPALIGPGTQWVKRSALPVFDSMLEAGKYTNADWSFYDSVIYATDRMERRPVTQYQQKIFAEYLPTVSGGEIARYILTMRLRVASAIMTRERDNRLLHLMDSLYEAAKYFSRHSGRDDGTPEFAQFIGIIQHVRPFLEASPDEWYDRFKTIAPAWDLEKSRKEREATI